MYDKPEWFKNCDSELQGIIINAVNTDGEFTDEMLEHICRIMEGNITCYQSFIFLTWWWFGGGCAECAGKARSRKGVGFYV